MVGALRMIARILVIWLVILGGMIWTEDSQSQGTDNPKVNTHNADKPEHKEPFSIPVSILNTPIDELSNEENRERHRRESAYSEKNISIQEVIAEASEDIAHYTYLQICISAASIAGLLVTVIFSGLAWQQTRKATREAQKSTEIAKQSLEATKTAGKMQLRAYVTLDTITCDVHSNGLIDVQVVLQNCGQSPAFIRCIKRSIATYHVSVRPPDDGFTSTKSVVVVGAGCRHTFSNSMKVNPLELAIYRADLLSGERRIKLQVEISYTDIFGEAHTTEFTRTSEPVGAGQAFMSDLTVPDVAT